MMTTRGEATGLGFDGAAQSAKTTRKSPPSQTHVPPPAKWLGALGAIPFVFLAVAGPFLEAPLQESAHFALVAYGAVILSFLGWTGMARVVRGRFLALREDDFVMAAKLCGASEMRVILRHMVPSFLSHLIASLTLSIPGMILSETALSFLGRPCWPMASGL